MNYLIPDYDNIMQVLAEKKAHADLWHPRWLWKGQTSDSAKEGQGRFYFLRKCGREYIDGEFVSFEQLARYEKKQAKQRKAKKKMSK